MKDLFNEYDHKRKLLIKQNIEHFTETEFDEFVLKINEYLNDSKVYYDKINRKKQGYAKGLKIGLFVSF